VRGHAYDAWLGFAGCDKSLPGMMMAMSRLNVPSIFIYGGSILRQFAGPGQVTVQDMFEAGQSSPWARCRLPFDEIERVAARRRRVRRTNHRNTMATGGAIGLALPYSAGAPAPYEIRDAFCRPRARKVMENWSPLIYGGAADIVNPQIAGECRGRWLRIRWADQRRVEPAGDRT